MNRRKFFITLLAPFLVRLFPNKYYTYFMAVDPAFSHDYSAIVVANHQGLIIDNIDNIQNTITIRRGFLNESI